MREYLVEVICDTSFLIHLATRRIKNIDNLDIDIGPITFVVPQVVKNELLRLVKNSKKQPDVNKTLDYIKNLKVIFLDGTFADKELINFAKNNGSIIATMDKELKKQIKQKGGSVMSFSNNNLVLESQ